MQENKTNLLLILIGIGIISVLVLTTPISEAGLLDSGFIPPTPAWDQIRLTYDTWVSTGEDHVNATTYTDTLILISDGSILFNITTYP